MKIIVGGVLGKIPRPTPAMAVALLALLVASSGVAVAAGSFTASDGTITACRDNRTGTLRVIQSGQSCTASKETTITWKDGITGKVADADKLDGQDSAAFLGANQTAADSNKLDGLDSTDFAKSYKRTVVVNPVGTPTENGTALKNALSGISDASESNPYLLKIEPGTYDLGSSDAPLVMKPYVDVEGSGEGVTTITATGSENVQTGTVVGAANSEVRFLTVKSTGGTSATAIYSGATSSFRLTSMTAIASGGSSNFGVQVGLRANSTLNQTTVTASGGGESYGVFTRGNSQVQIRNSAITGATNTIASAGGVRVVTTQLVGGAAYGPAQYAPRCVAVYDENYNFYPDTCPAGTAG